MHVAIFPFNQAGQVVTSSVKAEKDITDFLNSGIKLSTILQSSQASVTFITIVYETEDEWLMARPEKLNASPITILGLPPSLEKKLKKANVQKIADIQRISPSLFISSRWATEAEVKIIEKKLERFRITLPE
jgi:hypothetical protein